MNVIRVRALRGPNLWSRHTAIEAIVQAEADDAAPAGMTALEADVRRLFPALGPLRSGVRAPRYGRPHLLEAVALALQAQAGCPVSFSRTAATGDAGTYQVVVQYSEEAVGPLRSNWRSSSSAPRRAARASTWPLRSRSCASSTKTSASAPAPAVSSTPPRRAASRRTA